MSDTAFFGALAQGLTGLATGIGGNIWNSLEQQKFLDQQQQFISNENRIMREREDNAIQRRMEDLAKSGINPLLAGSQPASANIGGMPSLQSGIDTSGNFNMMNDALNNAYARDIEMSYLTMAEKKLPLEMRQMLADAKLTEDEEMYAKQYFKNQVRKETATWYNLLKQAGLYDQNVQESLARTLLIGEQENLAKAQRGLYGAQTNYYNEEIEYLGAVKGLTEQERQLVMWNTLRAKQAHKLEYNEYWDYLQQASDKLEMTKSQKDILNTQAIMAFKDMNVKDLKNFLEAVGAGTEIIENVTGAFQKIKMGNYLDSKTGEDELNKAYQRMMNSLEGANTNAFGDNPPDWVYGY